jgi:hypothetical protein
MTEELNLLTNLLSSLIITMSNLSLSPDVINVYTYHLFIIGLPC